MSDWEEVRTVPWYVVPDDLVGGWAVATVDKPVSQIDHRKRSVGEAVIADFISEDDAKYIVGLHNETLKNQKLVTG